MRLFNILREFFNKEIINEELLRILVEKHGLKGRVTLHKKRDNQNLSCTLYRLIREGEDITHPLPQKFIDEIRKEYIPLIKKEVEKKGGKFKFSISNKGIVL